MAKKDDIVLIKDGVRLDGRKPDELRDVKMKVGVLKRANGSAYVEWGNNKVLAAVYGPRYLYPKFLQDPTKCILRCVYNMAPFSVDDRKRPGPDRRSVEISKITTEALNNVVLLEKFPNAVVDVFIEILQADAGTRCAGLTTAALALVDAGIPVKGIIASCAAGKVGGEIVVDLAKEEDNFGESDVPVALNPHTGEIVLLQMDGKLSKDEFKKAFGMALDGCRKINELQNAALRESLKNEGEQE